MAEHTRKDPRARVLSMTVRYKSATLDEFIEHHSHDVSRGGMYIKTPQPFPPGTLLKFEVKIAADQKVMQGVGRVVWRRESDDASAEHPAGMGVKFIKLDEESKDIIDQLITARMGDISAFDEVAPDTESQQPATAEPPAAPSHGNDSFFPKSQENSHQPAPEDRTVMKQATELLQEALKEVGGPSPSDSAMRAAAGDTAPKAPRTPGVTPAAGRPARSENVPQPQESTPRYQKIPTPVAATPRNVANAITEPARSKIGEPASVPGFEPSAPNATKKPFVSDAPKTVPASPMAARRVAPAETAQSGNRGAKSSNSRGLQVGIALALLIGAGVCTFALTRKHAPPPAPEPSPSVSQKVAAAPVVLNLGGDKPDAALPVPSSSPSAAPSEAPAASVVPSASAAEKPVAPPETEAPKADTAPKPKVTPAKRKKADAGAGSPPPLDTADDLYPTPAPAQAPAPAKTSSESSGASESPAPAATTTSKAKSKSTPSAAAPTTTEEPTP